MTLRHMEIFSEVYRARKVTQAAQALHMTQPAVSRALLELERHYGTRLFERTSRRLSPTQAGHALYAQAQQLLELFRRTEQSLSGWDEAGLLRVGGGMTFGSAVLPELALRFQQAQPRARLHVTVINAGSLQRMLMENTLDLALLEGTPTEAALVSVPFARHAFVPVVSMGHPLCAASCVTLEALTQHPLLLREPGSAGRAYIDSVFRTAGLEARPLWESMSTQAILRAVEMGVGVSILPEALVREAVEAGRVAALTLASGKLERDTCIAFHKDKFHTAAMETFLRICAETAGV